MKMRTIFLVVICVFVCSNVCGMRRNDNDNDNDIFETLRIVIPEEPTSGSPPNTFRSPSRSTVCSDDTGSVFILSEFDDESFNELVFDEDKVDKGVDRVIKFVYPGFKLKKEPIKEIIFVNGPCRSGKTTLLEAMKKMCDKKGVHKQYEAFKGQRFAFINMDYIVKKFFYEGRILPLYHLMDTPQGEKFPIWCGTKENREKIYTQAHKYQDLREFCEKYAFITDPIYKNIRQNLCDAIRELHKDGVVVVFERGMFRDKEFEWWVNKFADTNSVLINLTAQNGTLRKRAKESQDRRMELVESQINATNFYNNFRKRCLGGPIFTDRMKPGQVAQEVLKRVNTYRLKLKKQAFFNQESPRVTFVQGSMFQNLQLIKNVTNKDDLFM